MFTAFWSSPIDLYCERTDPSFWAEPVNALSNIAFLLASLSAFALWRRTPARDPATLALILVTALVGLGSFAFHTLATRAAMLLDVIPIVFFIYGYFLLALRRFLGLAWWPALALLAGFFALSAGLGALVPRAFVNGSSGYLPALAALLVIGWPLRGQPQGRALLWAAALFAAALGLRIVDLAGCGAFPLGTHFAWHVLNALVLYLLLRAAIADAAHGQS